MSGLAMEAATHAARYFNVNLTGIERAVFVGFALHGSHVGGGCFPSLPTVAMQTGFSVAAVENAVSVLRSYGLMELEAGQPERGGGRGRGRRYTLIFGDFTPYQDKDGKWVVPTRPSEKTRQDMRDVLKRVEAERDRVLAENRRLTELVAGMDTNRTPHDVGSSPKETPHDKRGLAPETPYGIPLNPLRGRDDSVRTQEVSKKVSVVCAGADEPVREATAPHTPPPPAPNVVLLLGNGAPKQPKPTDRPVLIPRDWVPTVADVKFLIDSGIEDDPLLACVEFRDKNLSSAWLSANWSAEWRSWCRNKPRKDRERAEDRASRNAAFAPKPKLTVQEELAARKRRMLKMAGFAVDEKGPTIDQDETVVAAKWRIG